MRQIISLLAVPIGLFLSARLAADDVHDQAEAALKRFYEDRQKQPFLKDPALRVDLAAKPHDHAVVTADSIAVPIDYQQNSKPTAFPCK